SLKAQFKSVDRNKAKYVVILGEYEVKNGTMNVKNISDKSQVTINQGELLETLKQWENK
ncbi:MAG: histidine--tRNA ligase, partial [Solobacterium sp.]|nr:histidine--tRNA ligase [Solobacterium sp.]